MRPPALDLLLTLEDPLNLRAGTLASCTAASGKPTTENPGRPALTSTSTSTGEASMPSSAKLQALQTDIT